MLKHVVEKGETLAKIANRYGVRAVDLLDSNSFIAHERSYVYPGTELLIPKSANSTFATGPFECLYEYGYTELLLDRNRLKQQRIKESVIGKSVMGKEIVAFEIGSGEIPIFYSGGWHANEWHTAKFLMTFLQTLIEAEVSKADLFGYSVYELLKKVTLHLVPLVNPDGVELVQQGIYPEHPFYEQVLAINKGARTFDHWSSNIRGVDLNHQWPAGWEKEAAESPQQPWPRHYSGPSPLSEPEAIAIDEYTKANDFAYVLAFHSQGQEIYWGYKGFEPNVSKAMVERLSLMSSYKPVHTADSDGGYKDWFIQETRRPGFTIEVGVGKNPLPLEAFGEIWSNNILLALEGLTLHELM